MLSSANFRSLDMAVPVKHSALSREDSAANVESMMREARTEGAESILGDGSRQGAIFSRIWM